MDAARTTPRIDARLPGLALVAWAFADLAFLRLAMRGRDAVQSFVGRPSIVWLIPAFLVVASLLVHGGSALLRARREGDAPGAFGDPSIRALQGWLGLAALPFVVVRLGLSPLGAYLLGVDGFGLHQLLRTFVPTPTGIAIHTLGVSAVAVHLHQGLVAATRARLGARVVPVSFLLAVVYALLWLDVLSAFGTGRALLPR